MQTESKCQKLHQETMSSIRGRAVANCREGCRLLTRWLRLRWWGGCLQMLLQCARLLHCHGVTRQTFQPECARHHEPHNGPSRTYRWRRAWQSTRFRPFPRCLSCASESVHRLNRYLSHTTFRVHFRLAGKFSLPRSRTSTTSHPTPSTRDSKLGVLRAPVGIIHGNVWGRMRTSIRRGCAGVLGVWDF